MSRYQLLTKKAPVGIITCDLKGNINYLNDHVLVLLGSPGREASKKINLLDFYLLKNTQFSTKLKQCLKTGETKIFEMEYVSLWGEHFWSKVFITAIDEKEEITGAQIIIDEITDYKLMEKELETYKKRFGQALNFANAGLWEYDVINGSLYWSKECEAVFGLEEGEFEGTFDAFLKRIHPDDRDYVIKENQPIFNLQKDIQLKYEHRIIQKDGTTRWVKELAGVVDNDSGKKVIGFIMDITDRKKMEKELISTKGMYENIVKTQKEMICRFLPDTTLTYVNDAYCRNLAKNRKELLGKKFLSFIPEKRHDMILKHLEKLAENEAEITYQHKILSENGKNIWHEWTDYPIYDEEGNIKGFQSMGLDITERKEQEKEITFLANAMKNVSDSVMLTDDEFKIKYINQATEKLFGYNLDELKNKTPDIFNVEPSADKIQQELYDKISAGETYNGEYLNKRKDGSTFVCEFKITPIKNNQGEIYAYSGIQRDITEKKKQRKKLNFQLQFQKTLAEISRLLFEVNSANIDRKLNKALKKIAKFFNVDRSFIFQLSQTEKLMYYSHDWCAENIKSIKDDIKSMPVDNYPWWMKKISNDEIINIEDLSEMPAHAEAEKGFLKTYGIDSLIVIPMVIDNNLFGCFSFDYKIKKIKFSKENIRSLKIFTDVIKNAFAKHLNNQRIIELSFNDSLTGLYNRRFFEAELERLDTKRQLPISFIMADINGLKLINDSLGHEKGDQLLIKSAELLKEETRNEDIIARYGGDEFVILLTKTKNEIAQKIIDRIKAKTKETADDELTVSIALGTASKTKSSQNINSVLKKADDNMYQNKLLESRSTKSKIVKGLLNSLEVKSNETKEHTLRMKELAAKFAKRLGLSNLKLNRLSLLASLHDIGKITIDKEILNKADSLTNKEWEIMQSHPETGYKIASSSKEFFVIAEEIYAHHERWDGSGYPRKLKGKEIPYLARIISIIDAYDVMTNERPYSKAITKEKALAEIKKCAGSQFDPELAEEFTLMMQNNS